LRRWTPTEESPDLRYFFDDYVLDSDRRELHGGSGLIAIEPQVFDLLAYLVRNRQHVATKDDLFASVWQGRFVSESALTTRINAARRAVGDSGEEQRLIRTLRRKGFRFVGAVREESGPVAASAADIAPDPPALALPLPDRPSIAVLAFANMSSDPEQEHFADGMVEDIITSLSRLRWLFVIARTSTFFYKGRAIDVKQIGRELGVRYVLEGSVRRAAGRVRITAQLIEAETGTHVWAKRYERAVTDVFAVQDQITDEITCALEPEIGASERERARRKPPESLDAWELFQRGMWHLLQHNREGFIEAEAFFRKAITLDPAFAAPHAGVALVGFFRVVRALTDEPAPILVEMLEEASRAVALDPREPLGHTALGLTFMERGEYAQSIAEHEIAVAQPQRVLRALELCLRPDVGGSQ
jgi:TolB-like protein